MSIAQEQENFEQLDTYLNTSPNKLETEFDLLSEFIDQKSQFSQPPSPSPAINENLLDLINIKFEQHHIQTNNTNDEIVQDRIIDIQGPITIHQGYITSYKLYKLKTKKIYSTHFDTLVERRFSDFQYLHYQLLENYGGYMIPRLPEKHIWSSLDMEAPQQIANRKQKLKKYIQRILTHKKLRVSEQFICFLFDRQNTFSQKKGQYFSQHKLSDTVATLTTNALETGYTFINRYINQNSSSQKQSSSINISTSGIFNTKSDQQINKFQITVNKMTLIIKEIKVIVMNVYEQYLCWTKFNQIFSALLKDDHKNSEIEDFSLIKNSNAIKKQTNNKQIMQMTKITSHQIIKLQQRKYEQLIQSYENLLQSVQACKQAINRRKQLYHSLKLLKNQQQLLQVKSKQNPRSSQMDILRNKIKNISRKSEKFTNQLLEQLKEQINNSKEMINQFVKELFDAKHQLYGGNF